MSETFYLNCGCRGSSDFRGSSIISEVTCYCSFAGLMCIGTEVGGGGELNKNRPVNCRKLSMAMFSCSITKNFKNVSPFLSK